MSENQVILWAGVFAARRSSHACQLCSALFQGCCTVQRMLCQTHSDGDCQLTSEQHPGQGGKRGCLCLWRRKVKSQAHKDTTAYFASVMDGRPAFYMICGSLLNSRDAFKCLFAYCKALCQGRKVCLDLAVQGKTLLVPEVQLCKLFVYCKKDKCSI